MRGKIRHQDQIQYPVTADFSNFLHFLGVRTFKNLHYCLVAKTNHNAVKRLLKQEFSLEGLR